MGLHTKVCWAYFSMITLEQLTNKVEEMFGDSVANPEHSPIVFSYQVRLARWMLEQQVESKDPQ